MKTITHLIIFMAIFASLTASAQNGGSDDELQYAEYLVNNGRSVLAYPTLNKIIAKTPSSHYAHYLRALNYFNDGNPKSALYDIDEALKRRPLETQYLKLKGDVLSALGKYGKAAECYSKAVKSNDEPPMQILYSAAQAYLRAKDYGNASHYASIMLDAAPESDSAKLLAAEIHIADNNTTDALRVINTVIKHDAQFYRLRGIAYCKSEMNDYAISDLNAALDIEPTLSDIYIWRGLAKYQSGNRKGAHDDWNTAISKRQYEAKNMLQKYR
ncbi:MAG: tetratricopeptide repeat protein [Bacteroidales bacterium]|nr:tetratricopeptide repeat protein [Bacteroidales bacterium]